MARFRTIRANSDECIRMIKEWLTQCTSHHKECQREIATSESEPRLPDRVLYIGSKLRGPRLVVSGEKQHENQKSFKYAALSYRWGGDDPLLLKEENVADFQHGHFPKPLPQTFRDAIDICRALQIDYLWIDALCIIQASDEDWAQQSSKMCNIYSNAYVTIAADAAEDPQAGFLEVGRREAIERISEIRLRGDSYPESSVFVRPITFLDDSEYFEHHGMGGTNDCSCLGRRGWILQESLLSPHIIHFSRQEIAWQCASGFLCECARSSTSSEVNRPHAGLAAGGDRHRWRLQLENLRTDWLGVVEVFTGRHLTQATDRLAAMAGLAQRAQLSRPGVQYHAGIWENNIRRSLLWVAAERLGDHKRITSEPSIAPSWSWASITGRVNYNWRVEATDFEDIVINNPCPNQYGSVAGLELTATSHIFRVRVVSSQTLHTTDRNVPDMSRVLTFLVIDPSTDNSRVCTGRLWPDSTKDSELIQTGTDLLIANCRFFLEFMVLERLPNTDSSFRRVGLLVSGMIIVRDIFRGQIQHEGASLPPSSGTKERITIL